MRTEIDWASVLSGVACVGIGATGFFSYKAGKKEADSEKKDWKNYILPGITGLATVGCVLMANHISHATIAALGGTIGYLVTQRSAILSRLEESINVGRGPEDEGYLEPSVIQDVESFDDSFIGSAEKTGHGNQLCFEGFFGRWFYSSEDAVNEAVNKFASYYSNEIETCGYTAMPYNDLYELLDIQSSHVGWNFGYNNTDGWCPDKIEFNCHYVPIKGHRVYVIEPKSSGSYPIEGWYEV